MYRTARSIALALAIVATVVTCRVSAQVCEPGRAPVDGSGYCCWPGQHFDEERQRCAGAPHCPSGWVGSGAECVTVGSEHSAASVRAIQDGPLIIGGALLFSAVYLGATLMHGLMGMSHTYGPGVVAPAWPLTFVPVLHNLCMIGNNAQTGTAAIMFAVGFLAGALEIGGLAMAILGSIGNRVPDDSRARVSLGATDSLISVRFDTSF